MGFLGIAAASEQFHSQYVQDNYDARAAELGISESDASFQNAVSQESGGFEIDRQIELIQDRYFESIGQLEAAASDEDIAFHIIEQSDPSERNRLKTIDVVRLVHLYELHRRGGLSEEGLERRIDGLVAVLGAEDEYYDQLRQESQHVINEYNEAKEILGPDATVNEIFDYIAENRTEITVSNLNREDILQIIEVRHSLDHGGLGEGQRAELRAELLVEAIILGVIYQRSEKRDEKVKKERKRQKKEEKIELSRQNAKMESRRRADEAARQRAFAKQSAKRKRESKRA